MSWAYERHNGEPCLVEYTGVGDASVIILAKFVSDAAAERHKAQHAKLLRIARKAVAERDWS